MTAELSALLADGRARFSPHYADRLANHLPMCLIALEQLGAEPARLESFARAYVGRLEPVGAPPEQLVTIRAGLAVDRDAAIGLALDPCLASLAAEAFHPLLWTAYAVIAGDEDELAAALANHGRVAAGRAETLPAAPPPEVAGAGLDEVLAEVLALGIARPAARTVDARLVAIAGAPGFADAIARWRQPADPLRALAASARRLYARQADFSALHAITGTHAARVVWPWITRREEAARVLLVALAACHVDAGVTELPLEPGAASELAAPSWASVSAAALTSDDDHVAKLVLACREEAAAWEEPGYLALAHGKARTAPPGEGPKAP